MGQVFLMGSLCLLVEEDKMHLSINTFIYELKEGECNVIGSGEIIFHPTPTTWQRLETTGHLSKQLCYYKKDKIRCSRRHT